MQKIINRVTKMSRPVSKPKPRVMVDGIPKYGSRSEVFHGNAMMTTGKLTKDDLVRNKHGYIKSKRKVQQAKNPDTNPLLKMGLLAKKGSKNFGPNISSNSELNNNSKKVKSNRKSKNNRKSNNNRKSKKTKKSKLFGIF